MNTWYMLTVVGRDHPGMVAQVSNALFAAGCNLGEASMTRLGDSFTVMLMVHFTGSLTALEQVIAPVTAALGLKSHIDAIDGGLHRHETPDLRITVFGADRAGIVAQVTHGLATAGFNILDLQSDVGGTEERPIYIMQIEGHAREGLNAVEQAMQQLTQQGIEIRLTSIDTLIG